MSRWRFCWQLWYGCHPVKLLMAFCDLVNTFVDGVVQAIVIPAKYHVFTYNKTIITIIFLGSKACKTPLKFSMFATLWSQEKEKRFLLHHYLDYAMIMIKIFLFFISLRRSLCKYLLASTHYIHDVTNLSRRSPP